jgi:DNA-binding NarL/FixJ family response regulator
VYLVEDQPALRRMLEKSLGGYPELAVTGSAEEGTAALAAIEADTPDLVLADLELPGIDGIALTRALKARRPSLEVLILTTFDDEQKVFQALQAGASGYLVKRLGPEKIRDAILEVMAGGTVLEPRIARRFWNYFDSVKAAAGTPPHDPWGLTDAEREVLRFVAKGLTNPEVAKVMGTTRRAVRTHLTHLYSKMGVSSHVEAVVLALRHGLVEL